MSMDSQELQKDVEGLKTAQAVQAATQAGAMATMTAMNAGTVGTVSAGGAGLALGVMLGLWIGRTGIRS